MRKPTIPGPDLNTRIPKFKTPPGTCDTHCHIFGPDSVYPYAEDASYVPPDAGLVAFTTLHVKIGAERAVIVNASCHGLDNTPVTDAIAVSGGLYKGIGNVDETFSEKDIAALDKAGIMGCRFTFLKRLGRTPDMSAFHRVVDKIKGFGWHVVIYLEPDTVPDFAPILSALPVSYVIDHMGTVKAAKGGVDQPGFVALLDLAKRDEKCWVKCTGLERTSAAGAPFHDAVPFAKKLVETIPDRVLWGTDWPHPNVPVMPNDGDLVDLVPLYAEDAKAQQKLLVDNPARLYKF
jgi:predicted TIM-barrel fold metal-dependent hydrolase